jgi:cob(I)alamin adenosyltransferase
LFLGSPFVSIYTRKGDDGTTGLLHGGRVSKASPIPEALGAIDEAQAAIGVARAHSDGTVREILTATAADLWTVMADVAENPDRIHGAHVELPGRTAALERTIDEVTGRFEMPTDFVVPGDNPLSAHIDVARAAVRRAERAAIGAESSSEAVVYLNRLSDLLWALARWTETDSTLAKNESDLTGE